MTGNFSDTDADAEGAMLYSNDSYNLSGSFSNGSFSLSTYVIQGNAAGSSSNSDNLQQQDNGAASSFSSTQQSQQTDTLYQAGTQCAGAYSNSSYNYQDAANNTMTDAAQGPGYGSSDTLVQQNSTALYANGGNNASSSATYSYQTGNGGSTLTNNGSVSPSNNVAAALVQFVAPDGNLLPTVGANQQSSTSSSTGTAVASGSVAPVVANVSLQQVGDGGAWLSSTQQTAMQAINAAGSSGRSGTTGGTSGGVTVAGFALQNYHGTNPHLLMMSAAAGSALEPSFLPAASAPVMSGYGVQVWNSLRPLFAVMDTWLGGPSWTVESSLRQVLNIYLPPSPSRGPPTGDPFVDMVDSMLYNNGQPLTAGSAPLYGTYWDGMGHSAGSNSRWQ